MSFPDSLSSWPLRERYPRIQRTRRKMDKREAVVMKVARTDAEGIYLPSIDSPVRSVAKMSLFSLVHSRSQLGKVFKKPPATSIIGIDLLCLVRSGMKSPSTMLSLI
ncbi:hypothetical protein CPB85DRAFT_1434227 [Mucidula mucida]|nr:hypothetical protein CPB85DRAFT_1434227 [Mucidula mucida]